MPSIKQFSLNFDFDTSCRY